MKKYTNLKIDPKDTVFVNIYENGKFAEQISYAEYEDEWEGYDYDIEELTYTLFLTTTEKEYGYEEL